MGPPATSLRRATPADAAAVADIAEAAYSPYLDRIRLFTHVTMVENQRLYARRGYVETHRATERGFTRVFLEKLL